MFERHIAAAKMLLEQFIEAGDADHAEEMREIVMNLQGRGDARDFVGAPVRGTAPKTFCTAGPPGPEHYKLELLKTYEGDDRVPRWLLSRWRQLCDERKWFMVVGQRQSGKSSSCRELCAALNSITCADGRSEYLSVLVDLMGMSPMADWPTVIRTGHWLDVWRYVDEALAGHLAYTARGLSTFDSDAALSTVIADHRESSKFPSFLHLWATHLRDAEAGRKLVLIMDEYETIGGDARTQLFNTLRAAYCKRVDGFATASSVILVGMRGYTPESVGGSPYNINAETFHPPMFGLKQIRDLFSQHTAATGQVFEDGVFESVLEWTGGQPWLVNKVGELTCFDVDYRPLRGEAVTKEHVQMAVDYIITGYSAHIESLERWIERDPGVRSVVEALQVKRHTRRFEVGDRCNVALSKQIGLIVSCTGDVPYKYANKIYETKWS